MSNFVVFGFVMMFTISGTEKVESSEIIDHFKERNYVHFNKQSHIIQNCNYEDLLNENSIVYAPIIPSRIIKEKTLSLFIPHIYREQEQMPPRLSYERSFSPSQKDSIRTLNLKRYTDFNQIYINEVFCDKLSFYFAQHANDDEWGLSTIIPSSKFRLGENVLEVRKEYYSEKGTQKIVRIPFYFEGG